MLSISDIDKIYEQFESVTDLNSEFLIKLLIEHVKSIDKSKIDFEKSEIGITESFQLNLVSKNSANCNIYFEILDDAVFDIQLDKGGEYLYYHKIANWNDLNVLRSSLFELLSSNVKEECTLSGKRLMRVKYLVNEKSYESVFGSSFLKTVSVQTRSYEPWIDK